MICPQCGYDIGNNSKCVRCGYEVKTLVAVDDKDGHKEGERAESERLETKIIDPEKTYLTDEYGNSVDDDDDYYDPFDMLFGNLFDPIGDLLGGLFGFDVQTGHSSSRSANSRLKEKREEDDNVVEVKKVEIYDENGNPVKQEGKIKKTVNKVKNKIKNMAKGNNDVNGSK